MRPRVYAPDGPSASVLDRFWCKVEVASPDECWLWVAGRQANGYGVFKIGRQPARPEAQSQIVAHRFAWELAHALPVPPGLFVCHHCDVRHCCNPGHLFLGDNAANMLDMYAKGRGGAAQAAAREATRRFTDDEVRAIRSDPRGTCALARHYDVDQSTIGKIRRRLRYAHVE